jgi:hypothetical protein
VIVTGIKQDSNVLVASTHPAAAASPQRTLAVAPQRSQRSAPKAFPPGLPGKRGSIGTRPA